MPNLFSSTFIELLDSRASKFCSNRNIYPSSSDVSDGIFEDDGDVRALRAELKQCKEDLLNDEKIFADQQLDFEQVRDCLFMC